MNLFARRPRKPFFGLTAVGILGILLADFVRLPVWLLAGLAVSLGVGLLWRPRAAGVLALTVVGFALLHTVRHVQDPARQFAVSLPANGTTARLEGIVWSEPTVFADGRGMARANFWVKIERFDLKNALVGELGLVRWCGEAPVYGDRVKVTGVAERLEGTRNPGEFDSAAWLSRQGVHFQVATAAPSDGAIVDHGVGQPLRHFAIASRAWIKERLDLGLPSDPQISALISSMVLGMRGETPADLKELFQQTGTLHLFAVSGLNVAMLAVIAWSLLKPFRLGRKRAALLIVPFLAAYAVVVGMSASCVRATVMAAFILLAPLVERESVPLNSLAAAAFAILAWDTNEIFNPGFQLSFVLVIAIFTLALRIQERFEKPLLPDEFVPRRLWTPWQRAQAASARMVGGMGGMGLACWLGSVLFMAGYFHLVSPIALLANVVAVPIAFCILGLGLFSLITGTFALSAVTTVVNHANWFAAKALILCVEAFALVPRGHLYVEWPRFRAEPACELVSLDVGEGSAAHVRAGKSDWLIDAGHERDYERTLLPYLRMRGINRIEGLLLSHGDSAHIGAAKFVFEDFGPGWVGDTYALDRSPTRRALHLDLAKGEQGRRFFKRGDMIPLSSGVQFQVLYPPDDWPRALADDKAMVLRLEAAGRRILFVSDIGFSVEQWLLRNEADLQADVVVKGWPERDHSGTADFISAIRPQAIVCAAPKFGTGKDAFDAWAEPMRKRGIQVVSQKDRGAVRVRIERDGTVDLATWR